MDIPHTEKLMFHFLTLDLLEVLMMSCAASVRIPCFSNIVTWAMLPRYPVCKISGQNVMDALKL